MSVLLCATTNSEKFGIARSFCARYDIDLQQVKLDIDEIQGEDPVRIVNDKAQKAYLAAGKPVVVTDDSWSIPGLGGFPGPYMKSIIQWFTPDDFIRLTKDLTDRRIILQQYIAFAGGQETKVFHDELTGTLAMAPRGEFGAPSMKVIQMDFDDGKTLSEVYDAGMQHNPARLERRSSDAWKLFAEWYAKEKAA